MHHRFTHLFATVALSGAIAAAPALAEGMKVVKHTSMPILGSVMEGDNSEWISPQAKRSESTMTTKGGFLGAMSKMSRGAGREHIIITRLDKGVVWTLDPASKTYTETPIERFQEGAPPQAAGREPQQTREKPTMRVVDADFNVKVTGEEKTINGFPCKQSIMDGFIELEDTQTKDRSRWEFHNEKWATPETAEMKRYQEIEKEYRANYMAKLGLSTPDARTAGPMLAGLMGTTGITGPQLAKATAKLAAAGAKATGFAIVDHFRWTMSGKPGGQGGAQPDHGEEQEQNPLASLLGGGRGGQGGGGGGFNLEGTTEFRSIAAENGDFEIPAGYRKIER